MTPPPDPTPSAEEKRISFLVARNGEVAARAWCLDTLRSYRRVVLGRKTHTMYRRKLIESYLAFKRFAR